MFVRNEPFAGGYIVRAYADPPTLEALQLEIRYTNYLDRSHIDEPEPPRPSRTELRRLEQGCDPLCSRRSRRSQRPAASQYLDTILISPGVISRRSRYRR